MSDDMGWFVIMCCAFIFLILILEIYVVMLMATFLASWFGFTGILWWVCAILMFGIINGLIITVWRL